MAYCFGDGFDCYATANDPYAGYWDGGTVTGMTLVAGRFAGSQAINFASGSGLIQLFKSSAVNDSVHHIVCAYRTTTALSGTSALANFQFCDGATQQCSIVFRSDGVILLTSGAPNGTTLATYTGAVSAQNTWFAFEFEVVINNTTGSFTARKNGNTSNDFTLGSLNTRGGTANNYANRLNVNCFTTPGVAVQLDDILWRSDAASVNWIGDVRCYTRMPASDAAVQFARAPSPVPVTMAVSSTASDPTGTSRYTPFTASATGTVGTLSVQINTGFTGNLKCALFADSSGFPAAVLGSATTLVNPVTGANTVTFGTPVAVTKGTAYWWGVSHDVTAVVSVGNTSVGRTSTAVAYASFPTASPTVGGTTNATAGTVNITPTISSEFVSETLQDGTTTYVYDSTVGHSDLYTLAALSGTPNSTVAVITRGFVSKSDAGTRNAALQLKSGGTTVQTPAPALSTTFGWLWRADTTDPATGSAWTAVGVNAAQIGPCVTV